MFTRKGQTLGSVLAQDDSAQDDSDKAKPKAAAKPKPSEPAQGKPSGESKDSPTK